MRTGTIAFMIGIVAAQQSSQIPSTVWLLLIPIALLGIYAAKPWLKPIFALVLGFNWVFASILLFQNNTFPQALEGKQLLLEGAIASIPSVSKRSTQFIFRTQLENKTHLLKLSWYEKLYRPPKAGEHWRLLVKLKRPHGSMNPGGFDYERNLYRKGISATGYVRRNDVNQVLNDTEIEPSMADRIVRLRQSLSTSLQNVLSKKSHAGIIEALAIGERKRMTSSEWEVLTRTGTIHLVAISGLHIGLVAGFAFLLMRLLVSRIPLLLRSMPVQIPAAAAAIMAALVYALLAGFTIPTQRAFLMVCVVMLSLIQRRTVSASNIIAFSLLVILVFDPMSVLDIGFWLSFAAVAVILLAATGRIKSPSVIGGTSKVQFVIAIGMLPLMLLFFQRVSLSAPLANVIAVPWVSFITVPSTLLGVITLDIFPLLSKGLLSIASESLDLLWVLLEWLSSQHWAVIETPTPVLWTLIPAAVAAIYLLMPRGVPARWLAPVLFLPALMVTKSRPDEGSLNLTLLDVGQGLSVVLQTKNHSLVFDTGPRYSARSDAGKNIIIPFLKSQGISRVDALIVSHGDNDHSGGANALLNTFPVQMLYSGASTKRWQHKQSIPCNAGQSWQWDGIQFEILHPQKNVARGGNNRSCVLQVRVDDKVILLPADIEKKAEAQLIQYYGEQLKSDILIAPHHGSKTSSSSAFMEAVSPELVLIADGYRNRYRFPHYSVIKRYDSDSIKWFETQNSGAISVNITSTGISQPLRWRDKLRRYWHSQ